MAASIRLTGGNRQDFHIGNTLPIKHHAGARIVEGLLMVLFGGVFAGFPVLFATLWLKDPSRFSGSAAAAVAMLGVFLVIGLAIIAVGINGWLHRLEIDIDANGVRGRRRGIRGTRIWHEPLSRYRGVLTEEEYHSGGKNRSSYTLYKITLKHAVDDDLDVLLYSSRSSTGHRDQAEVFARMLERPVLQEIGAGEFAERAVEDLDKSVQQLVAEGKLSVPGAPSGPPPIKRLQVRPERNGYTIDLNYRSVFLFVMGVLFAGVGSGLVYWYFGPGITGGEGSPWVVPAVGGVFSVVGFFMVVFVFLGRSLLHVLPDRVRLRTQLAGVTLQDRHLSGSAIEEVTVQGGNRGQRCLRMSGDTGHLELGTGLGENALKYMRDIVISTLAQR